MNRDRIVALFTVVVLYFVALYVYVPSLPAYIEHRTSSLSAVGVVLSMYGLWMAVLRMPLGVVTDATGRSKVYLIGGVLLAGLGALVMALGSTLGALAFGRALTGLAAAAWVPMLVVFSSFFPPERTIFATSLAAFACSIGQMLGTGSTGLLEKLGGTRMTFFAAGAFALIAAAILAFMKIPRANASQRAHVTAKSVLSVFRRRDVIVPSFTNAFCQFCLWAVVFGFMPLLAHRMGADAVTTSLLMTLNVAANTAANLLATFVAHRSGRRIILYGTFAAFAGAALMAGLAETIPLLFISNAVMGLANGLWFPILVGLAIEKVDSRHRTVAMGLHQAVYAIGMFTGPWIGGVLADAFGIRAMFIIVAAFSVVGPSVMMTMDRRRAVR